MADTVDGAVFRIRGIAKAFLRSDRGATAIEYALIASLISIFIIGTLTLLRGEMLTMFEFIGDNAIPALGG